MFYRCLPLLLALSFACAPKDKDATDDTPTETDSEQVAGECAHPAQEAGPLQAGFAKTRIPAPVGIGTAGFGPFGAPSSKTPFNNLYPGTKAVHGHPEIRTVVLSRGEGHEVVFVRIDGVGVFSQLRNDIVEKVKARTGRDLDDALIFGATHSHSGPGRVINPGTSTDTGFYNFVADTFFPEFYARFVDDIVDSIATAYDDLKPAEIGTAIADSEDAHQDRRCEDGTDAGDGSLPLIAVKRGGEIEALVFSYAIHGTIMGIDDLTLSRDSAGGIEEAIEDRFDHPVMALFLNAWGADMAPASPDVTHDPDAANVSGHFAQMRDVGEAVARAVDAKIPTLSWDTEPTLALKTHRFEIHRDLMGYDDDIWPYPNGAVFCGQNVDAECDNDGNLSGLDRVCIPFPAPRQTTTTVGQVGPYTLLTWPGEPGTKLVQALTARIHEAHSDVGEVMFVGYAQDYMGYSILEDDWWKGGYEASGALWGPKQGQFISDRVVDAYDAWTRNACPETEPSKLEPFPMPAFEPYKPATAIDAGTIATDVEASYGPNGVITFTVQGSDPWLGTPLATIERGDASKVTRPGGEVLTSDTLNFTVSLQVLPDWPEAAASRTFLWTFTMPVRQPTGGVSLEPGSYHIVVDVPTGSGTTEAESATFEVTE